MYSRFDLFNKLKKHDKYCIYKLMIFFKYKEISSINDRFSKKKKNHTTFCDVAELYVQ